MGITVVKTTAIFSILVAAGVAGISSGILRQAYNLTDRSLVRVATGVIFIYNESNAPTPVISFDPDVLVRKIMWCSGVVMASAGVQALTSLILFVLSVSKVVSDRMTCHLFTFFNTTILGIIASAMSCILLTLHSLPRELQFFIGVAAIDVLFLYIFSLVLVTAIGFNTSLNPPVRNYLYRY